MTHADMADIRPTSTESRHISDIFADLADIRPTLAAQGVKWAIFADMADIKLTSLEYRHLSAILAEIRPTSAEDRHEFA